MTERKRSTKPAEDAQATERPAVTTDGVDEGADLDDGLVAVTPTVTLLGSDLEALPPGSVRRVDPSDPEIARYMKAGLLLPAGD